MKNILALAGLLAFATQASAISMVYTNEASFLGAVDAGYYLNDFNTITGYAYLGTAPRAYAGGGFSYTITSSGGFYGVIPGGNGALSTLNESDVMNVAFTSGNVTAVGGIFSLTDYNGSSNTGTVTVNLSDSTSETFAAGSFRGFTSGGPLITSLSFKSDSTGDDNHYPTLDHIYAGKASVPDGGTTLVLLGGALTGLGALRRKLRR